MGGLEIVSMNRKMQGHTGVGGGHALLAIGNTTWRLNDFGCLTAARSSGRGSLLQPNMNPVSHIYGLTIALAQQVSLVVVVM